MMRGLVPTRSSRLDVEEAFVACPACEFPIHVRDPTCLNIRDRVKTHIARSHPDLGVRDASVLAEVAAARSCSHPAREVVDELGGRLRCLRCGVRIFEPDRDLVGGAP